jgi:N-acetylglucosaminyldiphosphoundecaprenol N-acetyl-beta-D-mannosaminyltransferase
MHEHRDSLRVPAVVGVGQAFDIHSGETPQAPRWMQTNGLEWLFRLYREPRRLWRRYLIYNTKFILALLFESPYSNSRN